MTHPLTPREKVAKEIVDRTGVGTLGLTYEASQSVALGIADAILTALASGSGDHAELARLAEGVIKGDDSLVAAVRSLKAFHAAANPATVLALLAENAALRADRDRIAEELHGEINYAAEQSVRAAEAERALAEHSITADLLVSSLKADLAEAERKLAEAVGLLKEARDEIQTQADAATPEWQRRVYECSRADYEQDMDIPNRIDAFLSKEAER